MAQATIEYDQRADTAFRLEVVGGVDTHAETHTAAALDQVGRVLGTATFPTTRAGYQDLHSWLQNQGACVRVGVEGTSSYGLGLTRHLQDVGVTVSEVTRPDRKTRRLAGKDDPTDAIAAARAVLADDRIAIPKGHNDTAEAIRTLHNSYQLLVKQRTQIQNQIKSSLITAPDDVRTELGSLTTKQLIITCARFRPDMTRLDRPDQAIKHSLHLMAQQHRLLTTSIVSLKRELDKLTTIVRPDLRDIKGVGPINGAQLICTYGDKPDRITNESAFAKLCGTAPIAASSGKTIRHRLNRGGDRQANCAIHQILLTRLAHDPRTREYRDRRLAQGKTKKETYRCLKRFITREIYKTLNNPQNTP